MEFGSDRRSRILGVLSLVLLVIRIFVVDSRFDFEVFYLFFRFFGDWL